MSTRLKKSDKILKKIHSERVRSSNISTKFQIDSKAFARDNPILIFKKCYFNKFVIKKKNKIKFWKKYTVKVLASRIFPRNFKSIEKFLHVIIQLLFSKKCYFVIKTIKIVMKAWNFAIHHFLMSHTYSLNIKFFW